jgi:hypothetical protein
MKKIPNKINIGGIDFEVELTEDIIHSDDGARLWGQIKHDQSKIIVYSKLEEKKRWSVFFHEVLHGIEEIGNFDFGESGTDRLAHMLVDVLTRNDLGLQ